MSLESLLKTERHILSAGSVYELLRRSPEVVFDEHIFHAGLIYDEHFADVLERVFRAYIDKAVASGLSIAIGTATWRASEERIRASAFSDREVNEDNARFLNDIRNSYAGAPISILILGDIGPRGDAYNPGQALDTNAALTFHSYQIERLASANVDYLQASTIPALSEAKGIALAMAKTGLPYNISFVVDSSGSLLDGTRLGEAISRIDDVVGDDSARYGINCVHPTILLRALDRNPEIEGRIVSFCGNTSDLSAAELDGLEELQTQDPVAFALVNKQLLEAHDIPIVGACCGSNPEHIREIAGFLKNQRVS
jgi:homocysteine S-methyltransferase